MNNSADVLAGPALPVDAGLTEMELWIQLMIYIFLAGIYCMICNLIVTVAIYQTKTLRTRFFIIVGFLSAGRVLEGVQMFLVGAQRSLRTLGVVSVSQKRYACNLLHFWLLHGMALESLLFLVLVFDRVMAIARVAKYRTFQLKSACQIGVGAYLLSILLMNAPAYVGIDLDETVPCVITYSAISDGSNFFMRVVDFILIICVIAGYAALALYIQCRHSTTDRVAGTQAEQATIARQLALMPYLRNQIFMHVALSLSTKLFYFLAAIVVQHGKRLAAYGGILMTLDLVINTSLLLFRNREIRVASSTVLKKLWRAPSSTPVASVPVVTIRSGQTT